MPTEKIDIVVGEPNGGSRIIQRSLDAIAATATRAVSPLRSLRDMVNNFGAGTRSAAGPADELRRRMQGMIGPAQQVTAQLEAQVRQLRALRNAAQTPQYQELLRQQAALKKEIAGLESPTRSLTDQMWAARSAVAGWAAALGLLVKELQLADQFVTLENRLRATGLAGEELVRVQRRLYESANQTRSSVQGTIELYSRLSRSSAELGVTEEQLISFTTSLNQAILLSGATAQEAQAGLIQLSQGMASGTLRGDELRSVLEQLPEVADVIAQHLGVTRGQLRQLGTDGKITAKDIIDAFRKAEPELAERFARLAPTMGQAFTVLKNNMLELAGENGKGGVSQLSQAILDLADSLLLLKPAFQAVGFVVQSTVQIFRVAWQAIQALGSGTIPLILASIGRAVTETLGKIFNKMAAIFDKLPGPANNPLVAGFKSMLHTIAEFADGSSDYLEQVQKDSIDFIAKTGQNIVDIYAVQDQVEAARKKKPPPPPPGLSDKELERIKSSLISLASQYDRVFGAQQRFADGVATLERAEASKLITEAQSIRLQNLMGKALQDELFPLEAVNRGLDERQANLKLTASQLSIQNEITRIQQDLQSKGLVLTDKELGQLRSRLEFLQAAEETEQRRAALKKTIQGPAADLNTTISDVVELREEQAVTLTEAQSFAASLLENTKLTYAQVNQLRQADLLSEQQASDYRRRMWLAENEARYNAASSTFGNLAVLAQSSNKKMAAIGKAAAVTQATIDGVLAVQKALASAPPPWNLALAASIGVVTAANVAKITDMPGFAFGGDFTVGGTGGTDSQVVAFRATPGEKVSVKTPSQESQSSKSSGSAPAGGVRVVNVIDPHMVGDYLDSPSGERVMVNWIRRNADTVRQVLA